MRGRKAAMQTSLPGGIRALEPPDPISNSEVKTFSADDSVGFPHVKVGHCQALIQQERLILTDGPFFCLAKKPIDHHSINSTESKVRASNRCSLCQLAI